jgi:3-hydroxyisobutyrate dehydrogenase-like beta-hydroxyacid dehydrogenase
MEGKHIGILHPGQMGISLAATLQNGGHSVHWASQGRSPQTRRRADEFHLQDSGTLEDLGKTCDVLVSMCPPGAAQEVAEQVRESAFRGLYLDANAISPQRAVGIAQEMETAGIAFVDGSIIGGPAWKPGETWLYLSGERAQDLAVLFSAGPLEVEIVGEQPGRASALKVCYAAYTKGRTALLAAILAAAQLLGVRPDLERIWSRQWPGFSEETRENTRRVTAKAWRFAGEMEETAATFQSAGLPGEFHLAAAQIYSRLAGFKGDAPLPSLDDVIAALLKETGRNSTGI